MPIIMILVSIVLAYFIGFLGRNRKLGFWGHFFASLLLTPIFGLLLIVATDPRKDEDTEKKEKKTKVISDK